MRNNSNTLSFVFMGIVLVSVLIFKTDHDAKAKPSYQESIKQTSLTAAVQPVLFSQPANISLISPAKPALIFVQQTVEPEEIKPVKKSGAGDPALSAKISFAKDLDTGKLLFGKNEDKYWPIASITKLMTALIAFEKIGPEKISAISQSAIDIDDSKSGNFLAGEKYYIRDLVRIMLMISSNKAAAAIAEFYGTENFIKEMNLEAVKIGLSGRFSDSSGLSVLNQFTAEDLVKLAEYIINKKPEIFEYTTPKQMAFLELSSTTAKVFSNINYFAGREDFLGGKTGYIESSEQNLLSLFSYKNHRILTIILGSADRFADTENLLNWIKNSYEF